MRTRSFDIAAWLVTVAAVTSAAAPDAVRLSDVKVLTLYDSKQTTGRRSAPMPQLVCREGCGQWSPDMVQCYNMGSDGHDAAWKCEASMMEGYSFSFVEVGCEGYEYPEDPFILKGSCQLVYSLNAPRWDARPRDYNSRQSWENTESAGSDFSTRVATWAALGMIGFVLYTIFQIFTERAPGPPSSTGGGTGGGGDGWGGWGGGGGGSGGGGGGGDNWRGGGSDNHPPSKGAPAPSAPPAPAEGGGGALPWLAAGGIGAALGYMLRPHRPTHAPGGLNSWNRGYSGGGGAYRRRGSGGGGGGGATGGGGGGGGGLQAGYGGTTRR